MSYGRKSFSFLPDDGDETVRGRSAAADGAASPLPVSYPGYNEICGYPDEAVNSNDKTWNKNVNVLEFINRQQGFTGKVYLFLLDHVPCILNRNRSRIYINSDTDALNFRAVLTVGGCSLSSGLWVCRPDLLTYFAEKRIPGNLCALCANGAGRDGRFRPSGAVRDQCSEDGMIGDPLDALVIENTRDKTTLIVTCGHGAETRSEGWMWKDHGTNIRGLGGRLAGGHRRIRRQEESAGSGDAKLYQKRSWAMRDGCLTGFLIFVRRSVRPMR